MGKNIDKCTECGNKMILIHRLIQEFDIDEEPYEPGKKEKHEMSCIYEDIYINALYCEKCKKFDWIGIEADFFDKASVGLIEQ